MFWLYYIVYDKIISFFLIILKCSVIIIMCQAIIYYTLISNRKQISVHRTKKHIHYTTLPPHTHTCTHTQQRDFSVLKNDWRNIDVLIGYVINILLCSCFAFDVFWTYVKYFLNDVICWNIYWMTCERGGHGVTNPSFLKITTHVVRSINIQKVTAH